MIPRRLLWHTVAISAVFLVGLSPPIAAQSPLPGWTMRTVSPATAPLRVLIIYDMEGLSGIDRYAMTTCDDPSAYAAGQDQLVADVDAVVEGLVAAGVARIEVMDRHGSGCDDDPDLPASRLHPRAIHVDERSAPLLERITRREWDAAALVGAHASPGWNGFLEHVGSFGIERIVNGVSVSESEQHALLLSNGEIPLIFASGDDRLGAQLTERLPWVTFVVVKRATSRSTATLRAPSAVRADLVAAAGAAVNRRDRAMLIALAPPFTGAYKPVWPYSLEPLRALPGLDVSEGLIRVAGATPRDVNLAINQISVLVASVHTANAHWESVRRDARLDRFRDSLFMRQWQIGPPARQPPGR